MKSLRRKTKEFDAKATWQDYHSRYPVKTHLPDVSDRKETEEWKKKYSNRNTLFKLRLNESKEFKSLEEKKTCAR